MRRLRFEKMIFQLPAQWVFLICRIKKYFLFGIRNVRCVHWHSLKLGDAKRLVKAQILRLQECFKMSLFVACKKASNATFYVCKNDFPTPRSVSFVDLSSWKLFSFRNSKRSLFWLTQFETWWCKTSRQNSNFKASRMLEKCF